MTSGRVSDNRTAPALGAARNESATTFFGVSFSIRNGYSLYALWVRPPPQGFSQASFSSNRTVLRPAFARHSAAKEPAGPPPSTAIFFIWVVQAAPEDVPAAEAPACPRAGRRRRADSPSP